MKEPLYHEIRVQRVNTNLINTEEKHKHTQTKPNKTKTLHHVARKWSDTGGDMMLEQLQKKISYSLASHHLKQQSEIIIIIIIIIINFICTVQDCIAINATLHFKVSFLLC